MPQKLSWDFTRLKNGDEVVFVNLLDEEHEPELGKVSGRENGFIHVKDAYNYTFYFKPDGYSAGGSFLLVACNG